jgi:addiction module HigA family antidote
MEARAVSRSQIITNPDWLHNPHAGEMLASEFMEPLGIDANALGLALDTPADHIRSVIAGDEVLDAELDLRLARYFRMSEGFFLGLQIDYELMEAKRALNGELDRIVPRAA